MHYKITINLQASLSHTYDNNKQEKNTSTTTHHAPKHRGQSTNLQQKQTLKL